MTAIFVDTSFYIAAANVRDADHEAAVRHWKSIRRPMLTSEYVLVETGNWLAGSGDRGAFLRLIDGLGRDRQTTVVPASPELFQAGLRLYRSRGDKEWGMTDCISFAIMGANKLNEALTADRHFQQAGFRALLMDGS